MLCVIAYSKMYGVYTSWYANNDNNNNNNNSIF